MLRVGLTGGIGSGKTTVAAGLAARGAGVVDADAIAREVVRPGGPALATVVERFGTSILNADGTLDRPRLAAVVFADRVALADLDRITHPVIGAEVLRRLDALCVAGPPTGVAVVDQPLLTLESARRYRLDIVVVVDAPVETAVARLMAHRGFDEADARARVAAQASREERRSLADLVIDNEGSAEALEEHIEDVWADLRRRAEAGAARR